MKITEDCINHNVVRLIGEMLTDMTDWCGEKTFEDHLRIETLGEIKGILTLAETMKEVLRS